MRTLLLLIAIYVALPVHAQLNEGRMWLGFSVGKSFENRMGIAVEQQLRINSDFRAFQQTFTEVELNWEADKIPVEVAAMYRYSFQGNDMMHRLSAQGAYTYKSKPWYLTLRLTLQEDMFRVAQSETFFRYKLQLRHRFNKRWSVYAGSETWTRALPEAEGLYRIRWSAGSRYSKKKTRIRLFYNYQRGYGAEISESAHTLSLKYGLRL